MPHQELVRRRPPAAVVAALHSPELNSLATLVPKVRQMAVKLDRPPRVESQLPQVGRNRRLQTRQEPRRAMLCPRHNL